MGLLAFWHFSGYACDCVWFSCNMLTELWKNEMSHNLTQGRRSYSKWGISALCEGGYTSVSFLGDVCMQYDISSGGLTIVMWLRLRLVKVAMSDAARTVRRLRLRMKCIMRSDPMLFVRGREKIMTVNIAWLLCHLHCLYGTCLGPVMDDYIHTCTAYSIIPHAIPTYRVLPHAPCVLLSVAFSCSTEPCWCRAVHGGQRAEAPACQRLQECL